MAYSRQGDLTKFKHDTCAVRLFVKKTIEQIHSLPYRERIKVIHQMTDGYASQYKGKIPLLIYHIARKTMMPLLSEIFMKQNHGKGPCDGLGATAKTTAHKAVLQGAVIRNTTEFHEFCVKNLEQVADKIQGHLLADRQAQAEFSKRMFIFVCREDLEHNRSQIRKSGQTVEGTRKLHCVATVKPEQILCRKLSCYYVHCLSLDCGKCSSIATVGHLIKQMISVTSKDNDNGQPSHSNDHTDDESVS